MEFLWKTVTVILNFHLGMAVNLHEFLHGLRTGRVTGTTSLGDKILQKLATMREEVLYQIFLYLCKAYNSSDGNRCLDILEGYGVGPMFIHLLRLNWGCLIMVAKAGAYCATPFKGYQGFTHREPL